MQVAQVFGYNLAIVVDGEEADEQQQQELQPLALSGLKARLTTAAAGAPAQQATAAGRTSRVRSCVCTQLAIETFATSWRVPLQYMEHVLCSDAFVPVMA